MNLVNPSNAGAQRLLLSLAAATAVAIASAFALK